MHSNANGAQQPCRGGQVDGRVGIPSIFGDTRVIQMNENKMEIAGGEGSADSTIIIIFTSSASDLNRSSC